MLIGIGAGDGRCGRRQVPAVTAAGAGETGVGFSVFAIAI